MANWKTIVAGTGIGAGIIAIAAYAFRLKKASDHMETVTTAKIHSLNLTGLTIRVDAVLKNPSKTSLKLKFPFVKLIYNKKTIGTSEIINKDIEIPAFGQAHIDEVMIKIPIIDLLSVAAGFYKLIARSEPVNMYVETSSIIDLGWKKLAYSKREDVTLNPKT